MTEAFTRRRPPSPMAPAAARPSLLCPSFPSSSSSSASSRTPYLRVLSPSPVVFATQALTSSRSRSVRILDRYQPARATLAVDSTATDGSRLQSGSPTVLLEVKDLKAVIAESNQMVLRGINLTIREGEVRFAHPPLLSFNRNRFNNSQLYCHQLTKLGVPPLT